MQIHISNNIRIRNPSTPVLAAVMKALTLDNPAHIKRKKRHQPTYGIPKRLQLYVFDQGDLVVPRGFTEELQDILQLHGFKLEELATLDLVDGWDVDFGGFNQDYQLRPDQADAVSSVLTRNGILVAPAGSGKTLMGIRYAWVKKKPTLWITHTKDLMYQSAKAAETYLDDVGEVGLIGDGQRNFGSGKLIVALVQSLQRNPDIIEGLKPIIGTVIVDEAHHFPAPQFIDTVNEFKAVNVLGLTATPDRKDGLEKYMYTGIGPKVYEITRDGLYEAGSLIKPEIKFVYTDFQYEQASDRNEIDSVDAGGEDLDYTALKAELIADERRAKLVAENILEAATQGSSIVITESVRYCFVLKKWVERFAESRWGVIPRMAVVHGGINEFTWRKAKNEADARWRVSEGLTADLRKHKTHGWQVKIKQYTDEELEEWQVTKEQRRDILAAAGRKEIDILFATQLAREGLDLPHLTVGHMAMPKRGDQGKGKRDGGAVEQEIGRIMRRDPNNPNKKAVWYDYVDFQVGVLNDQYYSRRRVYKRLGLKVPRKPKTERDTIDDFLGAMPW